jgi:hypothetical protein
MMLKLQYHSSKKCCSCGDLQALVRNGLVIRSHELGWLAVSISRVLLHLLETAASTSELNLQDSEWNSLGTHYFRAARHLMGYYNLFSSV